ncbi:SRPBCC family protein [Qaidamihabitans albus]|uniref:SRPBCC family protein n=1 Tax=Qaidamihabitans albus TaxID=2795733 RepID=UPI0018F242E9|nr:SRPBCC family protein [Qaidamihabitans albus]
MVVTAEEDVDAAPAALWAILADPEAWPRWTGSIDNVEVLDGNLHLGSRVRITQPGMWPLLWTVSEFEPGRALTCTASAGGVGTAASHTVGPLDGGRRSRLHLGLTQRGVMAPVVSLLLGHRVRRYVRLEAAGLKAAAEDHARRAAGEH